MIPELGHFSLILAFCLSLLLVGLPITGVLLGNERLMLSSRSLAAGQFVFMALSFALLAVAFLTDDFSVAVVAHNSNSLLPNYYKFSAIWGNHEGSLLLWALILSAWTLAVALFSRSLPTDIVARVLSVMAMIAVGFLLFMLATSNPFERLLPLSPMEGRDLNPLLQDIGLILHPPTLYFGYVGFSVAFAFAIAALSSGRLDAAWARWSRPWTLAAWVFLTVGITLGSWWAYYELGWGGWWFWDPVENASFMPWLAGTALLHSLAVTEKRGAFKSWTVLLAITTFSLSLLGTFLVRSGVLTSVHAFATDPARGLFILIFLGVVIGGSLTLYALRAPTVKSVAKFDGLSRETFLLVNNIILIVAMLTVLIGTLYPLLVAAMDGGKISVGPPYFNSTFIPLMSLLVLAMGIGPMLKWRRQSSMTYKKALLLAGLAAVVLAIVIPWLADDGFSFAAALSVAVAVWILAALYQTFRKKRQLNAGRISGFGMSYWGMVLGHVGLACCALGIGFSTAYSVERDLRLALGEQIQLGGWQFEFQGVTQFDGPNYRVEEGVIVASKGSQRFEMRPQKRRYFAQGSVMTEAAIDPGLFRDLYIALGEPLEEGAWSLRIHYKPFVRWIWLGGVVMAIGGGLSFSDRRYRKRTAQSQVVSGDGQSPERMGGQTVS